MFIKGSKQLITVRGLEKAYRQNKAVDGLSFEIVKGETFGLLGPNGAGKSTTIHLLIGLLRPDRGEVRVMGGDPWVAQTRQLIGVAPQALSLYEELTGQENLTFFARTYGLSAARIRQRVEWALAFAGLEDRARHRVATYSGGMKRRLNIAVALVHEPAILLLDEPTVGVDPQSRNHIFESIEMLQKQGLTILYTTHYMEEARRLCDRIAIVDRGKLLALDTVDGLIRQYGGTSHVVGEVLDCPSNLQLPGKMVEQCLRFASDHPLEEVARLTARGVRFQTLQINSPDLESVFLKLTGRSLRD
jgi:ABC-2 type transport system ATP-binding protein